MYEKLRDLGWTENELVHLAHNFHYEKEAKALVAVAFLLTIFAVIAVPFSYGYLGQILSEGVFLVTLFFISTALGGVFGALLVDLDNLDHVHHIVLLLVIPVFTVLSTFFSLNNINTLETAIIQHDAVVGALVFAFGFIAPYAFLVKQEWKSKIGQSNTLKQGTLFLRH